MKTKKITPKQQAIIDMRASEDCCPILLNLEKQILKFLGDEGAKYQNSYIGSFTVQ